MKKILLATSALVASAGIASADMALTGSANMGVTYDDSRATNEARLQYEIDFNIVGSGTTDGGLTFGASVDIDAKIDSASGNQTAPEGNAVTGEDLDPEVFISGNFGTLTVGNLDVANDSFGMIDLGFDGTIGIEEAAEGGSQVGSANVSYEYAFGDFGVLVTAHTINDDYGVALSYAPGDYSVAIGYDKNDATGADAIQVGGSATFGAIGVTAYAVNWDNGAGTDGTGYGIAGSYDFNGITITVAAADNDLQADASYGIGAEYDLGGGATLAGAVGSDNDVTKADLGVSFSF